jgi:hypothetical protein
LSITKAEAQQKVTDILPNRYALTIGSSVGGFGLEIGYKLEILAWDKKNQKINANIGIIGQAVSFDYYPLLKAGLNYSLHGLFFEYSITSIVGNYIYGDLVNIFGSNIKLVQIINAGYKFNDFPIFFSLGTSLRQEDFIDVGLILNELTIGVIME